MKEKLLALIGKPVQVQREESRLKFNLSGMLEDGDPDRPGETFYCRIGESATSGAMGIEFTPEKVEEIHSSVYHYIIYLK